MKKRFSYQRHQTKKVLQRLLGRVVAVALSGALGFCIGELATAGYFQAPWTEGRASDCLNVEHYFKDLGFNSDQVSVKDTVERIEILNVDGRPVSNLFEEQVFQNFYQSNPKPRHWFRGLAIPVGYGKGWFYQTGCTGLFYGDQPMRILKATPNTLILSRIEGLFQRGWTITPHPDMIFERMVPSEGGALRFKQYLEYTAHYPKRHGNLEKSKTTTPQDMISETHLIQIVKRISIATDAEVIEDAPATSVPSRSAEKSTGGKTVSDPSPQKPVEQTEI